MLLKWRPMESKGVLQERATPHTPLAMTLNVNVPEQREPIVRNDLVWGRSIPGNVI